MERPDDSRPVDTPSAITPAEPAPRTATAPTSAASLESDADCPFHTAMGQISHIALMQQVLHLEGELLPRADLADALEGWQQLYRLVRTRVCPVTRDAALSPYDLATLVDTAVPRLLPRTAPAQVRASLVQQLVACATCASPQLCPLGLPSRTGRS